MLGWEKESSEDDELDRLLEDSLVNDWTIKPGDRSLIHAICQYGGYNITRSNQSSQHFNLFVFYIKYRVKRLSVLRRLFTAKKWEHEVRCTGALIEYNLDFTAISYLTIFDRMVMSDKEDEIADEFGTLYEPVSLVRLYSHYLVNGASALSHPPENLRECSMYQLTSKAAREHEIIDVVGVHIDQQSP